jgi:uncharacterized protein (DUF1501 family)
MSDSQNISRRQFLGTAALGAGAMALSPLLANAKHVAKAKRVIFLTQSGGPSTIDMFDYKHSLKKYHETELPPSVRGNQRLTGMTSGYKKLTVCAPIRGNKQYGETGRWMSDLVPYMSGIVDDVTFIRSMTSEQVNHDPGITYFQTGSQIPGKPSVGAWVNRALGSSNKNLPGYVTMLSQGTGKKPGQPIFARLWGSGFLSSKYQGVKFGAGKNPIYFLNDPAGSSRDQKTKILSDINALNQLHQAEMGHPEIATRSAQYDMAYRMQESVPELMDLKDESEHTFKLYGPDSKKPGTYAANCLLARRMMERGVRYVQLFHRGWDQHVSLQTHLPSQCRDTDQASAALIIDLKQRGLLDDTLVVWCGEFGRTTYSQGKIGTGRDHHGRCFTSWLAGAGIKAGYDHGETDDHNYNIVKDKVEVRDLHATMLHLLGINHETETVKYQGLNQKLTGVEKARVVSEILA